LVEVGYPTLVTLFSLSWPVVGFLLWDWRFTELNLAQKYLIKMFTHYWRFTDETPYQIFFRIFLALTLLSAVGCASTQKQEESGEYVDDSVITSKVKAAILEEPALSSAEINVETFKGTVQLSDFVNSRADINKAVAVARGVDGVKSVKNDMRFK